ncbi:hypothetical protein VISI1226_09169 [Vibrio sinaloensis DSM 21326]|uniref:Uncharacterized protein n=1 Tax=Vibrio sinaloensis DSM 21326 TaxID=945550 RepID=E8MDP5_PHOS4|nr:hypothetical protein VISI1226_09169 [Vibrio sinaloensis DSM 21326]
MIKFGLPCDGWLDLHIALNANWATFSISDVGPNSVLQFLGVLSWLEDPQKTYIVHCNLEPALLTLNFEVYNDCVIVDAELEASKIGQASMSVSDFNAMYGREIRALLPYCKGNAWTCEVNT